MGRREFRWGLIAALGVGLLVRLLIIASPIGEIDADEAVVGLMARHIAFFGERPVFFWGQPYLGSLEAFSAAPLMRLFDANAFALKLVPTAYSLGFLVLSATLARRFFGTRPALATAAYLALPPVMWAVWSTKARGGYAELLCLGQALVWLTILLANARSPKFALLWGVLAGVCIWTHLLGVVYVAAALLFLAIGRRLRWSIAELATLVGGSLLGLTPAIVENVAHGFPTLAALLAPPDLPFDVLAQTLRFFRIGLPVLLGLGQPTTSEALFNVDWPTRLAARPWVAGVVLTLLIGALAWHGHAVLRLIRWGVDRVSEPAVLLFLTVIVPPVIAVTRFGFFASEPRYALPLYSAVPLLMGAIWRVPPRGQFNPVRWGVVGLLLVLNAWSLVSTDIRLWRAEETQDSTVATRAELTRYLLSEDRHQVYTDYWIAYPLMFETRENVLAYVVSGGFNRSVPPADNVQRTQNPAWVFTTAMDARREFETKLAELQGEARATDVSVYRVYADVQPLDAMRPVPPSPPRGG